MKIITFQDIALEIWKSERIHEILYRSVVKNDIGVVVECISHGASINQHFQIVRCETISKSTVTLLHQQWHYWQRWNQCKCSGIHSWTYRQSFTYRAGLGIGSWLACFARRKSEPTPMWETLKTSHLFITRHLVVMSKTQEYSCIPEQMSPSWMTWVQMLEHRPRLAWLCCPLLPVTTHVQ